MMSSVLITGATGGVGKAFAAECGHRGWDLFLTDLVEHPLAYVAQGVERMYGVTVHHAPCDLTDADQRDRFWQQIDRQGLRFHTLINVAGMEYQGAFEERQLTQLQTMVRLNIESTVEMTQRVLSHRDPDRTLRIINVSSLAAFYPMPYKAVYAASKRFLLDWSLAIGAELREQDVTVTALCPAGMPTHMRSIRSIEAQGLLGRLTVMNASDVVAIAVDRALAGRRLVVPGLVSRLTSRLSNLIPRLLALGWIHRRWVNDRREVPEMARPLTPSSPRHKVMP
jgi:hypothetical protein